VKKKESWLSLLASIADGLLWFNFLNIQIHLTIR